MRQTSFIIIACLLLLLSSCLKQKPDSISTNSADTIPHLTISYKERAKAVYDNILRLYGTTGNYVLENHPAQPGDPPVAYFWPHTSIVGGAMLLKSLGINDPSFQRLLDGMNDYWDDSRQPGGYQAIPKTMGQSDRYYDDNAIAGLDLIRAYQQTQQSSYLNLARHCLQFCMSGESIDQGGGLFWNESYRTNNPNHPWSIKAANVTALSANLALKLYQISPDPGYLIAAKRWYEWVRMKLQDPIDNMIWNDVALKDGSINRTKWAYNVGAMITNASLLYVITREQRYITEAKQYASSAFTYFTRQVSGKGRFFPPNDPWFTMILLRGFMDLYALDKNPGYIDLLASNVDYAWMNARNINGQFYEDWSGYTPGRYYSILTQESMVEIYGLLSKYKNE